MIPEKEVIRLSKIGSVTPEILPTLSMLVSGGGVVSGFPVEVGGRHSNMDVRN